MVLVNKREYYVFDLLFVLRPIIAIFSLAAQIIAMRTMNQKNCHVKKIKVRQNALRSTTKTHAQ